MGISEIRVALQPRAFLRFGGVANTFDARYMHTKNHDQALSANSAEQAGGAVAQTQNVAPGHEVFRCGGIEAAAVTMRRRVQLGMGLEFFGTQFSNWLHHSNIDAFSTFFFENSNCLLAVHIFVVWRYHAFIRDALLARHVTRISIAESHETQSIAADSDASNTGIPCEMQFKTVFVETGPWTRQVELKSPRNVVSHHDQPEVSFTDLINYGVLHVDRQRGEVMDDRALDTMLRRSYVVASDQVITDVEALQRTFVSGDRMAPFLADAAADGLLQQLRAHAWLHRTLQIPGKLAFDTFGLLALGMGVGTIILWMIPCDRYGWASPSN